MKLGKRILFGSFIIVLHFSYFLLFVFGLNLAALVAVGAGGVICLAFFYFLSKENNKSKKMNKQEMCKKALQLQQITEELLSVFFKYFDNSFLLIHSLFKEKRIFLGNETMDAQAYLNDIVEKNGIKLFTKEKEPLRALDEMDEKAIVESIESVSVHAENIINMINSVMNNLFADNQSRLNTYIQKDLLQKHLVENQYYSELVCEFLHAIVDNINLTSRPLSEEIYNIKKSVSMFLVNLSSWKNELTSSDSGKDFGNVINNYNLQNEEFKKTFSQIDENYKKLEADLDKINVTISRISENSNQIQDIAEKTKVLSINASIEAARAGVYGKGFKIISGEISKMSEDTQNFVHDIVDKIVDAREISATTIFEFNKGISDVIDRINKQRIDFEMIYKMLQNYYNDFKDIFETVSQFIREVNDNINKFNPIFQLHDISIQQMENITRIINHFLLEEDHHTQNLMDQSFVTPGENLNKEILTHIVGDIEKRITTDLEISLLNKFTKKYGLNKFIKLKDKSEGEIELFK
ncbi:MAG: hypothetical protein JXR70_15585 [Spirochaetales bacterium]|nr:hypothetical protein [Spirochaetales bacterium]